MWALSIGLVAALAWGLHDFLVRRISQGPNVLWQLLVVFVTGAIVLVPLSLWFGQWSASSARSVTLAALAGASYVAGTYGLYRAFDLAKVRQVAPVIAAYPIISLIIAAAQGRAVQVQEWLAVAAVVVGIGIVSALSDDHEQTRVQLGQALVWAVVGATGFATTIAMGQSAARDSDALSAVVLTRLAAAAIVVLLIALRRPSSAPARANLKTLIAMGVLDALALGLVMTAGRLPHAEYAAVGSSLFGLTTIVLAWQLLGEKLRALQWVGVVIVFAGIARLAVV